MDHRTDTLIRDAETVVTMAGDEIPGGWVALSGGTVAATGRAGEEPAATRTLSARGALVTPGLINTHHHIFQNLTRAYAPATGYELFDWLKALYPLWAAVDEEAVEVSTWVGLAELALGGCTTTTDMLYAHPRPRLIDAQIRAARDVGLRFHPARGALDLSEKDGGPAPEQLTESVEEILADSERLVHTYHDPAPGSMLRIALAPSTQAAVTERLMVETARLAERLDVRLHTHLAESLGEEEYCRETFGRRPVEQFEHVGWGSDRAWVAHFIFTEPQERERLGRWGTVVAHCPGSTMMLGAGAASLPALRDAGVTVGLGCDGSASTDHASLWLEARTALTGARERGGAGAATARDILRAATVDAAACLGREDGLGSLAPGAPADVVVWDLDEFAFAGAHTDPVEAWLRCGPVRPRHTLVQGHPLVEDGALTLPHTRTHDMLTTHAHHARRIQGLTEGT
ncbi:amidohydrolase family protein [Streptomyces tubbatahanensis]|uniref:Amidohydrolase family protein n=1 Tax=Streptomyces tubbatahanensis TaxID=2923272 RepID=A0ABY3Y028_9ACTN|nr:amidohydrolase family protein [Streptomyces tubbatahanensis]UNT00153.1 amidohydrolase family protein [Streptomyces tubbatahanensis]